MTRLVSFLAFLTVVAVAAVAFGEPAGAVVTVQRAEINNGQLRLEGTAVANRDITVDGVVMGRSEGGGQFRIERSPYSAPADCTVDVNDGSATAAVARLAGCAVAAPTTTVAPTTTTTVVAATTTTSVAPATTTTTAPPPAAGFRIVTTSPLPNANVGTEYTAFIEALGGNGGPIRWSLVAGRVPAGLRFVGDDFRLIQTTGVVGTPTQVETTTFAVEARDAAGATTRRTFTLTVDPPLPLEITNQGNVLATGTVGQPYATNLFAFGGVRPWTWSIIGTLPPGLRLDGNQISGTPTTAGSFTFTARVRSTDGQQAERVFTININPRT
ncbi:MAG TPA: Ig domain-containing protein [Acidimicrobiales bacterium]|nr:Ig domain-containing protein [Acidimicrobiales bacterium]